MNLPTHNKITMPFGATTDPYTTSNPHKGTDFAYGPDPTIYAPVDGKVTLVFNNGNDGNGVYMQAGDLQIGMLHADDFLVPNGSIVKAGYPIAIIGDTGFSFGKHLHLAVRKNGKYIDPMSVINKGGTVTEAERTAMEADKQAWVKRATDAEAGLAHLERALGHAYADLEKHKAGEAHLDRALKEAYLEIDKLKATSSDGKSSDAEKKLNQIKEILK